MYHDPRLDELAKILVEECVQAGPGTRVWIRAIGLSAAPAARAVYKHALAIGALPHYDLHDEQAGSLFYRFATDDQIRVEPHIARYIAENSDATITLIAEDNKRELATMDPKKMIERSVLMRPIKDIIMGKPWVLTTVPTPAHAQDAGMSSAEFTDYYFSATLRDWPKMEQEMKKWATKLEKSKVLRVVGQKTDLSMTIAGRHWVFDDWKANMPGGEVFTSPVAESVEGEIFFEFPLLRDGQIISDIWLRFEQGRVVDFTASTGKEKLAHLLETDTDARRLGEVAFGGNTGITQYMYNVLFDEKMAGTMHFALGQGFTECGGETQSALHMDIVKDMRLPGSQVLLDGKVFLKAGQVLL